MATYLYYCEKHGEFEIEHKMSEKLSVCPQCKEEGIDTPVKRLIAGGTSFELKGSCWASDNYK